VRQKGRGEGNANSLEYKRGVPGPSCPEKGSYCKLPRQGGGVPPRLLGGGGGEKGEGKATASGAAKKERVPDCFRTVREPRKEDRCYTTREKKKKKKGRGCAGPIKKGRLAARRGFHESVPGRKPSTPAAEGRKERGRSWPTSQRGNEEICPKSKTKGGGRGLLGKKGTASFEKGASASLSGGKRVRNGFLQRWERKGKRPSFREDFP